MQVHTLFNSLYAVYYKKKLLFGYEVTLSGVFFVLMPDKLFH